jgi:TolB protein
VRAFDNRRFQVPEGDAESVGDHGDSRVGTPSRMPLLPFASLSYDAARLTCLATDPWEVVVRRVISAGAIVILVLAMAPLARATVHGRNGRIAYRRYLNQAQTRGAIFTIKPSGTGLRQVTHPRRHVITTEPDWSPNGRWIAYHRDKGGRTRLFKIRRDGSGQTRLSHCTGNCLGDGFPAWSPSGNRIAFQRDLCGTDQTNLLTIFVMRANGSHVHRVLQKDATCATSHRYESTAPQWRPDGERLAFERFDRKLERRAIFTARLGGAGLRRLTPWRIDASQPDWSPNGRWIVFRSHEGSDTKGNILLVHPDGSGLHRITHGGGEHKWFSCSFSPNGKKITAARAPGVGSAGNADVYTMRLDGSGRRNVTSSRAWESAPDWGSRV